MDYRQMGERIYIRIDKGEEILAQVEDVCRKLHISAATFQGIGACGEVEVATYIPDRQEFLPHARNGMLEMISLIGNIVTGKQGNLVQHAHALFSAFDGATGRIDYLGGHLKKATVLYTAELVLVPVQGGNIGGSSAQNRLWCDCTRRQITRAQLHSYDIYFNIRLLRVIAEEPYRAEI